MSTAAQEQPESSAVRAALLAWYRHGHRDLPWRRLDDPYAIWISEIMLQQTRVETVKDYFRRFMARFPTPTDLAAAELDEVLTHWSGLGYYARARNLHAAAREIADRHGGRFPDDPAAVRALPGIGPYTAGAILSIAFGQRAAIVDGNVVRVLSRLVAEGGAPDATPVKRRLWQLAEALVPPPGEGGRNDPGDFNQALMELGATICVPQRPSCLVCPLSPHCAARKTGYPERYPGKKRERAVPMVDVVTLLLRRADTGEVLLLRRPPAGLWGGLWEPPTGPCEGEAVDAIVRLCAERLGFAPEQAAAPLPPFSHVLTHRHMRFQPHLLELPGPPPIALDGGYTAARWVPPGGPLALGLSSWVSGLLGSIKG